MSKHLLAALSMVMIVSACATVRESRVNPFNWFGNDTEEAVTVSANGGIIDNRSLAPQILSLSVDAFPGGAIVRTIGLPPTQGFWDAELVEIETDDPTALVYEFRLLPPVAQRRQGTQRSREIIAGASVSQVKLDRIRTITVVGTQNRRTVRR